MFEIYYISLEHPKIYYDFFAGYIAFKTLDLLIVTSYCLHFKKPGLGLFVDGPFKIKSLFGPEMTSIRSP